PSASPSAKRRWARADNFCPASVSASRREVRLNSRAPSRSSSRLTAFETVALDSASSVAAATNDRNSTTFAKIANASKSGSFAMTHSTNGLFWETMSFIGFYLYPKRGSVSRAHRIAAMEKSNDQETLRQGCPRHRRL